MQLAKHALCLALVAACAGDTGPAGSMGATGATGATGPAGPAGADGQVPVITAADWIAVCGTTASAEAGCFANTNNASFAALDKAFGISFYLGLEQPVAPVPSSVYLRLYDATNIATASTNTGPTITTDNTGGSNVLKCSFYTPAGKNTLPLVVNNSAAPGQPVSGYPFPTFIAPSSSNHTGTYSSVFTDSPNAAGFPSSFQGFLLCIDASTATREPVAIDATTLANTDWI